MRRREVRRDRATSGTTKVGALRRTERGARTLRIDRVSAGDRHSGGIVLVHGGETVGRGGLPVDGLEAVFEPT